MVEGAEGLGWRKNGLCHGKWTGRVKWGGDRRGVKRGEWGTELDEGVRPVVQ